MGLLNWIKELRGGWRRRLEEDALKHLHGCEWEGRQATVDSLRGALGLSPARVVELCGRLQRQGSVAMMANGFRLTAAGEAIALQVIRAHRLWERYLSDEAQMPIGRLHAEADRLEHRRQPAELQAMEAALGFPERDPHGDPIPQADGELARESAGMSLVEWPIGVTAEIVHLEDEPTTIFSQLVAAGLRVGQRIRVLESDRARIVFTDEGERYVLAPVIAANVSVVAVGSLGLGGVEAGGGMEDERKEVEMTLANLEQGCCARVARLDDELRGFSRRRLLDLGLTPGAKVCAEYASLTGDPVAYRVRGSLIAIRRDQAKWILIKG